MLNKLLFIVLLTFCFITPCFSATTHRYVDENAVGGNDDGTSQTDAWLSIASALTAGLGSDTKIWVRRVHTEALAADITANGDGSFLQPIEVIGWPRGTHSWNADFTNGSTTVDNIDENDADREKHQGRWLTGPDGYDYLITDITDANTIIIDRPYAGDTAENEDVTIKADEDFGDTPADGEDWASDADDLPQLDFSGGAFRIIHSTQDFWVYKNIEFVCGTEAQGTLRLYQARSAGINGCLFYSAGNAELIGIDYTSVDIDRTIIEGNSAGVNQRAIIIQGMGGLKLKNSAIYNMGDNGIYCYGGGGIIEITNVNIGVEAANDDDDIIFLQPINLIRARDLKLGGTNGDIAFTNQIESNQSEVVSVNHNKVLGAWKYFTPAVEVEKEAVTGTNANKKLSDDVLELNLITASTYTSGEIEWKQKVWESRKTYDAGTYNIKVWIFNDTGNTLNDTTFSDDICMRCRAEAAEYGDATTEYVSMPWTYSDEIDIADAADADDWDYLQCDSVVVDTNDSKIDCEILVSTYDADADVILIDLTSTNP